MCVACLEFIKDKLTVSELRDALRESTVDDPQHRDVVNTLIDQNSSPEDLKKKIKSLED